MEYKDITQHEIEALKNDANLSDAHTHQGQSPTQKEIVSRLPELWYQAEQIKYHELESAFLKEFFTFRKQPAALKSSTFLCSYAASISTAMVAQYFAQNNYTVAVQEPCFDNLTDLLKLAGNKLIPLDESHIFDVLNPGILEKNLHQYVTADVLYLTEPNNPTGKSISKRGPDYWQAIINFCKEANTLLMIDFCFAPYFFAEEDYKHFDVYALLEKSGVRYITLEDTGKSWPILDMKVAILKASIDVYSDLFDISTAYLLQVSPFALSVLTEYLKDARATSFAYTKNLILENWSTARDLLASTPIEICTPDVHVPVLWLRLPESTDGSELKKYLEKQYDVHIVPGEYFFWSHNGRIKNYIRIALARDKNIFEKSMIQFTNGVNAYYTHEK